MKRVSDDQILRAVWREMVRTTAAGCIDNYIGGRKAVRGEDFRRYAQDISITSRPIDVPLSYKHLRTRLVELIEAGQLCWVVGNCTFWINTEVAKEVFDYACKWWGDHGMPSGYDPERKAMRCVEVPNFDELANQLESELLERFGQAWSPETTNQERK